MSREGGRGRKTTGAAVGQECHGGGVKSFGRGSLGLEQSERKVLEEEMVFSWVLLQTSLLTHS